MDLWLVSEASYNNGYEKGKNAQLIEAIEEIMNLLPADLKKRVQNQYKTNTPFGEWQQCLIAIQTLSDYWQDM